MMRFLCQFFGHNIEDRSTDKSYTYSVCKRCGDTFCVFTIYGQEQLAKERYKREHLAEYGVKILWEDGKGPYRSRIAIVPLSFLTDYLQITDAKTSATFNVDPVDDQHVKVTNIWSDGQ